MKKKVLMEMMSCLAVIGLVLPLAACGGGDGDKCAGVTCADHGSCNPDTGACACDTGYTGADCTTCASGYQDNDGNGSCMPDCTTGGGNCGAHGSCDDSSGVALCTCDQGYSGDACDACAAGFQDNDGDGSCQADCVTSGIICGAHAQCDDSGGTAVCGCETGYQDNDADGDCQPNCATSGLDCGDHGSCVDASGTALCVCSLGWAGDDCSMCAAGYHPEGGDCVEDTDCQANTCNQHGSCDDSSGVPVCSCDQEYAGAHCESCAAGYQDNDNDGSCMPDCATAQPACNAHSHCDDSGGTAACACNAEYVNPPQCAECATGYQDNDSDGSCLPTCSTSGVACGAHGNCADTSGTAMCVCDTGYAGELCNTCANGYQDYDGDGVCLDDCQTANLDCHTHGNCDDSTGLAHCNCYEGYAGTDCSTCDSGYQDNDNNNSCLPNCATSGLDCGAHGSCSDTGGTALCECQTGYAGDACAECAPGYQDNDNNGSCAEGCALAGLDCGTYGTCNDSSGTPTCECVEGYTGAGCTQCDTGYQDNDNNGTCHPDCTTAAPACVHGTCDDTGGEAVCACDAGYAGVLCDACQNGYQDNDDNGTCLPNCATAPISCTGHSHCDDTSGTAQCLCDDGYVNPPACDTCVAGYQDNDSNGSCLPDCDTIGYEVSCAVGGNGACDDSSGQAVCICNTGYTPDGMGHCTNATGYDCSSPLPLDLSASQVTGNTVGSGNDSSPSCSSYSTAEEIVYVFTVGEAVHAKFTTEGYDTIIYLRTDCTDSASEMACDDDGGPGTGSMIESDLTPGTYYLFIDGWSSNVGNYTLHIELSCGPGQLYDPGSDSCVDDPCLDPNPCNGPHMTICEPVLPASYLCHCDAGYIDDPGNPGTCIADPNPHGESCADAIPIQPVDGTIVGSTLDAVSDGTGTCGGNGPDRVYRFDLSESMRFEADMSGYDTVLHLRSVCDDQGSQIDCDDDGGVGTASHLDPTILDPGSYYLWADSYSAGGDFQLDVSFRTDPCATDPCPGTPECVASGDWSSYECVCPAGTLPWQGDCVDDPCDPNLCTALHQNICTPDLPGAYHCDCNLGYIDDPGNPGTCIEDPNANEWAFIDFINADNNLDQAGHDDVAEMATAGSTPYVHIVALFDTAGYSDDGHARKIYVTQGGYDVIEDMGEVDMGNWQTLRDFGIWAVTNYPARHYALVTWDHGSGWDKNKPQPLPYKGFSYDDSSGNNISVAGGGYGQALAGITAALGGKIDVVGHDECLMGMWEVAAATAPYAHYFVASEETEPWDGWAYNGFLPGLIADPTNISPADLAISIVDAYYNEASGDSTMGAINLDTMGDLNAAISNFADALMANSSFYSQVNSARSSTQSFADSSFRDLKDFAARVAGISGAPADLVAAANALVAQLDVTIIYNLAQSGYSGAYGLSIYLPSQGSSIGSDYTGAIWSQQTTWDEFLQDF
ncbi:MAG TPA: clostripain-related cysteine peptidase [Myxococcota bacterium]|nr:clostripain-related cysteine peptidase [Myxococcota bacterium]